MLLTFLSERCSTMPKQADGAEMNGGVIVTGAAQGAVNASPGLWQSRSIARADHVHHFGRQSAWDRLRSRLLAISRTDAEAWSTVVSRMVR